MELSKTKVTEGAAAHFIVKRAMDIVQADSNQLLQELSELQPELLNHIETDSLPLNPLIGIVLAVVAMECRVMKNTFDSSQATRIRGWILKEFKNDWPEANMVSSYFGQVEQALDQEGVWNPPISGVAEKLITDWTRKDAWDQSPLASPMLSAFLIGCLGSAKTLQAKYKLIVS